VDILLVTVVIYRIFRIIRGTRAVQILVGLAVLMVAYVGAEFFELFTLHWILNGFLSSIILVVVVLFQNDIRRALAHVGMNSLFRYRESAAMGAQAIEELMKASVSLANKRIGALIVLERGTNLRDHVEGGLEIGGRVSRELLLSIFLPYSPIHDGAVVIKDDKILWAGCFLPLTTRHDVDKELGTRHRAAVGITEETDAVVIVVSEERGAVSLALNGRITRDLEGASLRRVLTRLFPPPGETTKERRRRREARERAAAREAEA
jgi:uncharacterized protein (TIGR00159 family)